MVQPVRRTIKDTVFTNMFSHPYYVAQLYNALHPNEEKIKENEINIVTLQNILTESQYNDLGFIVKDKLIILVEAQSTWSDNVLIRMLVYLVESYNSYFSKTNQNMYSSKKLTLPAPEFYVIYTGDKDISKDEIVLSRDFFGHESFSLEAKVKIIRNKNDKDILSEYIQFCKVSTEVIKSMGTTDDAIVEIMRICSNKDILQEYLKEHESEVHDIMFKLFDENYIQELTLKEAFTKGEAAGEANGIVKGRKSVLAELLNKGIITKEQAAAMTVAV